MTNQPCKSCKRSYNRINGLYCTLLDRYVERAATPPCSAKVKPGKQ